MGVRYYTRVGKRSGVSTPWWMALAGLILAVTVLAVAAATFITYILIGTGILIAVILLSRLPGWLAAQKKAAATREAITLFDDGAARLAAGEQLTPEERKELDGFATSIILSWKPGEAAGTPLRDAASRFDQALKDHPLPPRL